MLLFCYFYILKVLELYVKIFPCGNQPFNFKRSLAKTFIYEVAWFLRHVKHFLSYFWRLLSFFIIIICHNRFIISHIFDIHQLTIYENLLIILATGITYNSSSGFVKRDGKMFIPPPPRNYNDMHFYDLKKNVLVSPSVLRAEILFCLLFTYACPSLCIPNLL